MMELSMLGLATAFAAGMVSFLSPCVLPLVPDHLSYIAGHSVHGGRGRAAPAAAVAGLGVPFVLAAAFTARMLHHLRTLRHLGRPLQVIAGVVMIGFGIAMMSGQLSAFAVWLLRTFPVLGSIG